MASLDIFKSDAFSLRSLSTSIDKVGYVPGLLRSLPGLFTVDQVATPDVWIEDREIGPAIIPVTARGAPKDSSIGEVRNARGFKTFRIAKKSRIHASELLNVRAFGSESEMASVMAEVARRQVRLRSDYELTIERMLLGMVQGLMVDGATTLYAWATEFSQMIPNEINFDLDNAAPASGVVRKKCNDVVRTILKGLRGMGGNAVRVVGLCGDAFWDDLTAHKEIRETYLNTVEAQNLRAGNAYESFTYGGITFINYRGTDDGTTVAINTDKVRFFPVNAGIFRWVQAPGESMDMVGTRGQELYSAIVTDDDMNEWADVHLMSYPLMVCTMPQALHLGKRT